MTPPIPDPSRSFSSSPSSPLPPTAPSPSPLLYVIVWREPPSPRLRTYVDPDTLTPYAYALSELKPPPTPSEILSTIPEIEEWLASTDPEPKAILAELAASLIGWDPVRAPSPPATP